MQHKCKTKICGQTVYTDDRSDCPKSLYQVELRSVNLDVDGIVQPIIEIYKKIYYAAQSVLYRPKHVVVGVLTLGPALVKVNFGRKPILVELLRFQFSKMARLM